MLVSDKQKHINIYQIGKVKLGLIQSPSNTHKVKLTESFETMEEL